jgi:hypothetical protein
LQRTLLAWKGTLSSERHLCWRCHCHGCDAGNVTVTWYAPQAQPISYALLGSFKVVRGPPTQPFLHSSAQCHPVTHWGTTTFSAHDTANMLRPNPIASDALVLAVDIGSINSAWCLFCRSSQTILYWQMHKLLDQHSPKIRDTSEVKRHLDSVMQALQPHLAGRSCQVLVEDQVLKGRQVRQGYSQKGLVFQSSATAMRLNVLSVPGMQSADRGCISEIQFLGHSTC